MKKFNKKFPEWSIKKTIFEARYKHSLDFFSLMLDTAKEFTNDFEHWINNSSLDITMHDFDKACSLAIKSDRFYFEDDSEKQGQNKSLFEKVVKIVPTKLSLTVFTRFGLRKKFLLDSSMQYQELVDVCDLKFLGQDEKLKKALSGKIKETAYTVDLDDAPFSFHIHLGPVKGGAEAAQWVGFNKNLHLGRDDHATKFNDIVATYPQSGLFLDIDCFSSTESLRTFIEPVDFIKRAEVRSNQMASALRDHFFSI